MINYSASVGERDIDGNAHMNNAAFVGHFDEAALGVLLSEGFEFADLGARPFLRNAQYTYDSQVRAGEVIEVKSSFQNKGTARILLGQEMSASGKVVARADLEYGLVRASRGAPQDHSDCVRIFEGWKKDIIEREGLGVEVLGKLGEGLFVRQAIYVYTSPFLITWPAIKGSLSYPGGARVLSVQEMFADDESLARASAEYVFVNLETGRPTRPPRELVEKLKV
ncbi:thioesterase family protein [Candidatus Pacearchaeota archaeon]|nr:thioesterase family protein [Candidatus Pacearchaeota archaeon]